MPIDAESANRIPSRKLAEDYWEILREYLEDPGEVLLNRGCEVSQRALADGRGVVEMAAVHHQALRRLFAEQSVEEEWLQAADDFFAECLCPFEMSHRGALEGTRALRHLNEVLEAKLKRVAHSLHDEAGQLLASVHIAVSEIAGGLPPEARGRFDAVENLLKQVEAELRKLSHEMRPTELDNLGLVPALEFLAENVTRRTGLRVYVDGEAGVRLPAAVETALYRIVQEAVNNAVKHAHAHSVRIELKRTPSKVACSVRDDGSGFDTRLETDGLGLIGIRERLNALGGSMRLVSESRRGTTLTTDIPLRG
ncbi:MAG TPA: ATP-binding protein [Burkholderiales bacterium]|nr:ATP-binding protein [Burkholderiales bacterium]